MIRTRSDIEVMVELGRRLKQLRLQADLSIAGLAQRSGLNRNTIVNAEAGANPRLETIVRVLRALGRLEALEAFLPPPPVSPIALVKSKGKIRQRASGRGG